MREKQKTLKTSCRYSGITLHTGVRAHITFNPAPEDYGITLVRIDLPERPEIKALASNVIDVQRATTIATGDAKVYTVEHILAALYAHGIDNALIEMDGPEPPIADGSSAAYTTIIGEAGFTQQKAAKKCFIVTEPIVVEAEDSKLILLPSEHYRISCTVKYDDGVLDTQYLSLAINQESFANQISRARTFCLYGEIEELMAKGLIKGGGLDNAVILHTLPEIELAPQCTDDARGNRIGVSQRIANGDYDHGRIGSLNSTNISCDSYAVCNPVPS